MFEKDYFLQGLAMQVAEYHNSAYVRLLTYNGGDYLVRDVVKTYEGAVSLNVWLDSAGVAPIVSGSSSFHEFDVNMPTNYKGITIPFEQIAEVHVVPADQNFGQFQVH
jgi:hypothetical protein